MFHNLGAGGLIGAWKALAPWTFTLRLKTASPQVA